MFKQEEPPPIAGEDEVQENQYEGRDIAMAIPDPMFVYLVPLGVTREGPTIVVMPYHRCIGDADAERIRNGARLDTVFDRSQLDASERARFVGVLKSLPGVNSVYYDNSTRLGAYWMHIKEIPRSGEEWAALGGIVVTQAVPTFLVNVASISIF